MNYYLMHLQHSVCNDKSELTSFNWIDNKPHAAFFTTALYQPHVQKITFNAHDRIVMHGDIHGIYTHSMVLLLH